MCFLLLALVVAQQADPAPKPEPPPPPRIPAQADPAQDGAVERRLREIFSELEGAEAIRVSVRSGVVALEGEVPSRDVREQAVELARQVEGVVEVQASIELARDVKRQLAPAVERLRDLGADVVAYLPLLGFALAVFLVFWLLAFLLGKWTWLFRRFTRNPFLADILRQLAKLAVLGLGLLVAFELMNATALVGTLLGAAGLLGLALGFALRDTVENYIAGILLSTRQPFVHDDLVDIDGKEGRVLRLTPRATVLMSLDGNHVRIPNAKVFNGVIVNYTRSPQRRFSFDVGVGTETALEEAQRLAARTLLEMQGVLKDPPPRADVRDLGDHNVVLRVLGWVDQREFDFHKVRSEAVRLVKEAYDRAGVSMPVPIRDLRVRREAPPSARPSGPASQAIDVGRRTDLERQIAEDRRESGESDLLLPDAPLE